MTEKKAQLKMQGDELHPNFKRNKMHEDLKARVKRVLEKGICKDTGLYYYANRITNPSPRTLLALRMEGIPYALVPQKSGQLLQILTNPNS